MTDVAIRPATYEDRFALARILIDATESAFRGRVPDRCLGWLTVEESAGNWGLNFENGVLRAGEHLYVAKVAGTDVIGLAMAGGRSPEAVEAVEAAQDYPHELRVLQVDPAWQRRGVGRRLVATIAEALALEGGSKLLVGILAENPNRGFYERLGARLIGTRPYNWEGYLTEELLFAWDDLSALLPGRRV